MENVTNDSLNQLFNEYALLPDFFGKKILTVNSKIGYGDYLINTAATRGDIEEIKILLDAGADINANGENNFSPLHNAVEQGHYEAVKFLIEKGADTLIKNSDGNSPADLALILNEENFLIY